MHKVIKIGVHKVIKNYSASENAGFKVDEQKKGTFCKGV